MASGGEATKDSEETMYEMLGYSCGYEVSLFPTPPPKEERKEVSPPSIRHGGNSQSLNSLGIRGTVHASCLRKLRPPIKQMHQEKLRLLEFVEAKET